MKAMHMPEKYHNWMFEFEQRHPKFADAERMFWTAYRSIRHPRTAFWDWRHWRQRPDVGEMCLYHDKLVTVREIVDRDMLRVEDAEGQIRIVSWFNCCDPVPKEGS